MKRVVLVLLSLVLLLSSTTTCFGAAYGAKVYNTEAKFEYLTRVLQLNKNWKAKSPTRPKSMKITVYIMERVWDSKAQKKVWITSKIYTKNVAASTLKKNYPKAYTFQYKYNIRIKTLVMLKKDCKWKITMSGTKKKKVKGKWKTVKWSIPPKIVKP